MSVVFRMSQFHFCMWVGCLLTLGSLCHATAKDDPVGLVKEKPAEAPFVETDRGYMVPYKSTIPGTEIEFEMIPIPGGTFQLGSPEDESDRTEAEGPQKTIAIEPFWMGKYEVTWNEYKRYMELHDIFKGFESFQMRAV
ncbi:MAG: SUMF1/EgtB/PvdO family nonheme iron enzyme, partial [Planctomycetota bacterium]|nr:SUMF1/EgtB/PvdO family nonheme iron enzyme [Planctomycetota bacterium]